MSDDQSPIVVDSLYKTFKLPQERHDGIKQAVIGLFRGEHGYRRQKVLNDISFEIKKGEFFGIVGRNGSGKSTLLKLLAGIYTPDKGNVSVNGSLTPFIELGVGFNPELTGRENVFLNGALLGFNHKEMQGKYKEIVKFSDLEPFMEQKLKNYSSGMQVRLAFSIAVQAKSDILLLDEVLAVGDDAFQRKCVSYFYDVKKSGQTVILVTHDMTNVEKFCDRALVLDKGKILGIYEPSKAKLVYDQLNREDPSDISGGNLETEWGGGEVKIGEVYLNQLKSKQIVVPQGEELSIGLNFISAKEPRNITIGLALYDESGLVLAGPNSEGRGFNSSEEVTYSIPKMSLNPGTYKLRIGVYADDHITELHHREAAAYITVTSEKTQHGKVNLFGEWKSSKR